jgi:hypothetical protein
VIVIGVLGDCDPLGSGELLFQVTSDHLLLLPSEGVSALVRMGLMYGLACGSHGGDESLLLLLRDSGGGLSCDRIILLLPLSGGGNLLLVDGEVGGVARHGWQDGEG